MHVAQLLDPLGTAPDVEVVKAFLPDVVWILLEGSGLGGIAATTHLPQNAARKAEFESLHDSRRSPLLRFANQQMNVLGHDHVADDHELISAPDSLKNGEKQIATVATAGDEMQVSASVVTGWVEGHTDDGSGGRTLIAVTGNTVRP